MIAVVKTHCSRASFLLVGLILCFAGNAHALLVTQEFNATKSVQDTFLFGRYDFNPFDGSLGTLQSVSYAMLFEGFTNTNVADCDGLAQTGPHCTGSFSLVVNFYSAQEPSFPGRFVVNMAQTDNMLEFYPGLDEVIVRGWGTSSLWESDSFDAWDLRMFETKSNFNYEISMLCNNRCVESQIDWSGTLRATLTYDYIPVPIAPTSILLVLGLALFSRIRRPRVG